MMPAEEEQKLEKLIAEELENLLTRCCQSAVRNLEPGFAGLIRAHLAESSRRSENAEAEAAAWTGIESLSRLRRVVGGRLENMKKKWLAAGLPVKAEKGAGVETAALEEAGWVELSNWILSRGYEVRRAADNSQYFFEVRRKA